MFITYNISFQSVIEATPAAAPEGKRSLKASDGAQLQGIFINFAILLSHFSSIVN